jgi:hypothetical protein
MCHALCSVELVWRWYYLCICYAVCMSKSFLLETEKYNDYCIFKFHMDVRVGRDFECSAMSIMILYDFRRRHPSFGGSDVRVIILVVR